MNNLATVQQIYAAFGRGDVPSITSKLTPNIEWEHDAVDHGIPWLRPGRGRGHVLEFFSIVGQSLDIKRFEVLNLLQNENQVVALIQIEAVVRSTGHAYRDYEAHVWTFGEDGSVTRFRHIVDTHQHFLASR